MIMIVLVELWKGCVDAKKIDYTLQETIKDLDESLFRYCNIT